MQVAPFLIVGCLFALCLGPLLNTLSLGEDVARGLGANVVLGRALSAAAVVLLCGAATAACGPIGFVGLTIPHVARMIVGPDYRWVLPYSMLLAPILLLAADIIGRVIARPGEVQVAIVTAVIGAPVFIALVRRQEAGRAVTAVLRPDGGHRRRRSPRPPSPYGWSGTADCRRTVVVSARARRRDCWRSSSPP